MKKDTNSTILLLDVLKVTSDYLELLTKRKLLTLRKLQLMHHFKDKLAKLKALLAQYNAVIQEQHRMLDIYRSILSLSSPNKRLTNRRPPGSF